jgi:hypothetical protein
MTTPAASSPRPCIAYYADHQASAPGLHQLLRDALGGNKWDWVGVDLTQPRPVTTDARPYAVFTFRRASDAMSTMTHPSWESDCKIHVRLAGVNASPEAQKRGGRERHISVDGNAKVHFDTTLFDVADTDPDDEPGRIQFDALTTAFNTAVYNIHAQYADVAKLTSDLATLKRAMAAKSVARAADIARILTGGGVQTKPSRALQTVHVVGGAHGVKYAGMTTTGAETADVCVITGIPSVQGVNAWAKFCAYKGQLLIVVLDSDDYIDADTNVKVDIESMPSASSVASVYKLTNEAYEAAVGRALDSLCAGARADVENDDDIPILLSAVEATVERLNISVGDLAPQ